MTSLNPPLVDGVDVDAVAAAVRACPGVDDLAAGALGSAASYLPGRTVAGIAVGDEEVTIQLRSRWAVPTAQVAAQVRSAVEGLTGGRRVDVVIADITDPQDTEPDAAGLTAPGRVVPAEGEPLGSALPTLETSEEVEQWSQASGQHAAPSSAPTIPTPAATRPVHSRLAGMGPATAAHRLGRAAGASEGACGCAPALAATPATRHPSPNRTPAPASALTSRLTLVLLPSIVR